jgi:hypothetical protein
MARGALRVCEGDAMNTILIPETPRLTSTQRVCAALSLTHAIVVTGGLFLVWIVRSFTIYQTFASFAEPAWIWLLELWPAWWLVCMLGSRGNWRRAMKPLIAATAIWLVTVIPALLLLWSMRGFR